MQQPWYWGLSRFGIDRRDLLDLGDRSVHARVALANHKLTRGIAAMSLSKRRAFLDARAERWAERIARTWWPTKPRVIRRRRRACAIEGDLPAKKLHLLERLVGVAHIQVMAVEGIRERQHRREPAEPSWFAVRSIVAIEVEGRRRGLQGIDDRITLMRAKSEEEAKRRYARSVARAHEPYLNALDEIVRWKLDSIVRVVCAVDVPADVDLDGAEVFWELRNRRVPRRR